MSREAPPAPFASSWRAGDPTGSSHGSATHEGARDDTDRSPFQSMSATTVAQGQDSPRREHRGFLDRFLNIFADVRPGEGVTVVLLMLNLFILLAGYYLLKTIREPLILASSGGAEAKSYAAAAIAGLLMILVPIYSALASRVSRVRLLNSVNLFFIACLIGFFLLNQAGVAIGVPFFIWVGIFN